MLFPAPRLRAALLSAALLPTAMGAEWEKQALTSDFLTEGAAVGDIDGDGTPDVVAGAFWFKGPEFSKRSRFRPGGAADVMAYQEDSFLSWVDDFDGDGKNDILMASHPGKNLTLFLNPGRSGDWPAHVVMTEAASECPLWTDLDGDGKKEFVCTQGGRFGYAEVGWDDATQPWTFVPVSGKRTDTPYVHGLGTGDLNGDGRADILAKDGWFQQPAAAGGDWEWHPVPFAAAGGSQMLVADFDGDGDADVVTSENAHGYGLAWHESHGGGRFTRHEILPGDPAATGAGGVQFSQLHALDAADFDGDGRLDFVTGKRYLAHNGHDPGSADPALTVLFLNRNSADGIRWQPEVIHRDTGVGCQVAAADVDGDGRPDVVVGNKKGVAVLRRP